MLLKPKHLGSVFCFHSRRTAALKAESVQPTPTSSLHLRLHPKMREVLQYKGQQTCKRGRGREEDAACATDNAVSALGKVLEHCGDCADGATLGETWVGALPLTADVVEARIVHEQLVRFVETSDRRFGRFLLLLHVPLSFTPAGNECRAGFCKGLAAVLQRFELGEWQLQVKDALHSRTWRYLQDTRRKQQAPGKDTDGASFCAGAWQ